MAWLVKKGVSLKLRDNILDMPLHTAARYGQKDIFQFLLVMGSEHEVVSVENKTPLAMFDRFPEKHDFCQEVQTLALAQGVSPYRRAIALCQFEMLRFLKTFVPISVEDRLAAVVALNDAGKSGFVRDLPDPSI